jgi:glycosyltransferase involved in cell wall biosynthesis
MKRDNVIFAYNGPVEVDEYGNYYGNELNDILVERYRLLGKNVTFLIRTRKIRSFDAGKYLKFKSKDFHVIPLPEFNSLYRFIISYFNLRKVIRDAVNATDILVARMPSRAGRIAIHYARKYKVPYLVEVVGCPWDALWNHSILGKLFAPYAFFRMKQTIKKSPYVQYVTKEFLQKRYPTSGISIGISDVILPKFEQTILDKRIDRIKSRDFKNDPILLSTFAGIDVKYKGHETVFQAIAILKKRGIHCKYFLVGKGDGLRLKRLADKLNVTDAIIFHGEIPHREVFSLLDEIDIYVQPSFQEGLPRAVVEAMGRACPVIGSDAGGIPELISDDMIFPKGNAKQLAAIIHSLDTKKLTALSTINFEKIKNYNLETLGKMRMDYYNLFLNSTMFLK